MGDFWALPSPPDYSTTGLFYVYYTKLNNDPVVSRFQVSGDPNIAEVVSEEVLLTINNPQTSHKGGTIAFSPVDGFLYLAPGDGGGGNDPDENAQNGQKLVGKVLRIAVGGGLGTPAVIPADNPFVGDPQVLDEIWAFGLRNPFRFSFDRDTGDLWIADVGQDAREEVNYEAANDPGGHNYGWDVMEGSQCNPNDPSDAVPCNDPSLTLPIHEYSHESPGNCSGSITGGYVYRGFISGIQGLYFFGDFCKGQIWSFHRESGDVIDRTAELGDASAPFQIVGFGEDGSGELYIVHIGGEVFRIVEGMIIDNSDADFTTVGEWPTSTYVSGFLGSDYQFASTSGTKSATWSFNITNPGEYSISARWTAHPNRATDATYTIVNNGIDVATVPVDQTVAGDQFNLLRTIFLEAGTLDVVLTNSASGFVIADAVQVR